jgi:muramoyltetrapeptide carboxypeptidase
MPAKVQYPAPLKNGDRIGVTAPSDGVTAPHHARLNLAIQHLQSFGYEVIEGKCLRGSKFHVSAPAEQRAAEFLEFWYDPTIKAIYPPWGGELLIEILPLLKFESLKNSNPKWIAGYSDISTLLFAMTLQAKIATLHSTSLMEFVSNQIDPLTKNAILPMTLKREQHFLQNSSQMFQKNFVKFEDQIDAPLNLTETTNWKILFGDQNQTTTMKGRLIGGCLDTITNLVGTPFGNVPEFVDAFKSDGVILYFENVEMAPCALARSLWNLRLANWFDGLSGIMVGRNAASKTLDSGLSDIDVLRSVFAGFEIPIIYDVDIGHQQPNLSLVNGALAEVTYSKGTGSIRQTFV